MEWRVKVLDATSRCREVVVTVRDGRVTVEPPPPAGFSMTAEETDELAGVLYAAAGWARVELTGGVREPPEHGPGESGLRG